jgi:hypothetical protein
MVVDFSNRLIGWGIAGAASVAGALLWSPPHDGSAPAPAPRQAATAAQDTRAPVPAKGSLGELLANARRDSLGGKAGELFSAPAPVPARPAPALAAAPAMAQNAVPPFPFNYVGWLRGSGKKEIYLQRGSSIISVKAGDVLKGFRIEAIGDEGMEVTWLSGGQRLSLAFADLTGAQDLPGAVAYSSSAFPTRASDGGASVQAGSRTVAANASAQPPSSSTAGGFTPAPASSPSAGGAIPTRAGAGGLLSSINAQQSAPSSGSMPTASAGGNAMQIDAAPSGAFPASAPPSGRLGVTPASAGKLGTEAVSSGKLGL